MSSHLYKNRRLIILSSWLGARVSATALVESTAVHESVGSRE